MIKTTTGTMISLRPISVQEFEQFADETGLPDSSYAWVHYNWGWEWNFYLNLLLGPFLLGAVWHGFPKSPVRWEKLRAAKPPKT